MTKDREGKVKPEATKDTIVHRTQIYWPLDNCKAPVLYGIGYHRSSGEMVIWKHGPSSDLQQMLDQHGDEGDCILRSTDGEPQVMYTSSGEGWVIPTGLWPPPLEEPRKIITLPRTNCKEIREIEEDDDVFLGYSKFHKCYYIMLR